MQVLMDLVTMCIINDILKLGYGSIGIVSIDAKRYDKEFKLHAVKQVVDLNKIVEQVVREVDISNQLLSKWVQNYK